MARNKKILGALDPAWAKMREVAAFMVLNYKTKKGTVKKEVFSIPSRSTKTKATNKIRTSVVQDSDANVLTGEGEFWSYLLDAVSEKG